MEPAGLTPPSLNPYLMHLVWQTDFSPTAFFSPGFGPFPQELQAVSWTKLHRLVLSKSGFGGRGRNSWACWAFSERRLSLKDAGELETQGEPHRCQLYCSKNTLYLYSTYILFSTATMETHAGFPHP